ncbi:MAG: branched-chain amino acid ABC-type transport system, permease component [Haloquadratum sp. J07HQX50]|jgi:Branched-chain amino acid ABC-type transport system, permease components|nr:MAG: branched-chain amino acid ABC-type transport system, permease component [Haloquadratum sp. J07HQX50]
MGVAERVWQGRGRISDRLGTILIAVMILILIGDILSQLLTGVIAVPYVASIIIEGIVVGLAYGLAGIGLSMTYSILSFANFAHGDTITVGAFSGWSVAYAIGGIGSTSFGSLFLLNATPGISIITSFWVVILGLISAAVITVAVSLAVDRLVYYPIRDAEGISLLIASIGVALTFRYLIAFFYGTSVRGITDPASKVGLFSVNGQIGVGVIRPDQQLAQLTSTDALPTFLELTSTTGPSEVILSMTLHAVVLVVVASLLMLGVHLLLQQTKLGKAMRAMADNKSLAQVSGIPTERIIRMTWIIGGALTGMAGFLIVLNSGTTNFNFGWRLLLYIFASVILGGIGSIYGAIAGGLIIGLVNSVAIIWLPSGLTKVAAFAVLIIVLLVRPEGLFGGVTTA